MTDYIKREDAVDVIARCAKTEDIVEGYPVGKWDEYVEYAKERLSEVPSADVAQVRHGHWIKNDPHCDGLAFLWNCSKCGAESEEGYRYCPACGARMDAKE